MGKKNKNNLDELIKELNKAEPIESSKVWAAVLFMVFALLIAFAVWYVVVWVICWAFAIPFTVKYVFGVWTIAVAIKMIIK